MALLYQIANQTPTSVKVAFDDVTAHVAQIIKTTNTTRVEAVLHWSCTHDALTNTASWWSQLHQLLKDAYLQEGTFVFMGGQLVFRLNSRSQTVAVVDGFLVPQEV